MQLCKLCIITSSCLLMVLGAWIWQPKPFIEAPPPRPDRRANNHASQPAEPRAQALTNAAKPLPAPKTPATLPQRPAQHAQPYMEEGKASWYADRLHGRNTASGEPYSKYKLTAAHPKLPFGSRVRVIHLRNQRSVIVTINDRGRFPHGRIIDLSRKAAEELQMIAEGVARVRVELIEKAP